MKVNQGQQLQNVNDIFDIFNAPTVTTNTNPQIQQQVDPFSFGNPNVNNQVNQNKDNDVFNMVTSANTSGTNFNNTSTSNNNYAEKKAVNLEDLLKSAYSNNNTNTMMNTGNTNPNTFVQPGSSMVTVS